MAHTFVKDVMISEVAVLDSLSMIKEAAKLMDHKNIGCVIVTKEKLPVGIITEKDIARSISIFSGKPIAKILVRDNN